MTAYRFITGDGRKHRTFEDACQHAALVQRTRGIIISVEQIK